MNDSADWSEQFSSDLHYGYLNVEVAAPLHHVPGLVLNGDGTTVEHTLLEELRRCERFIFSVAFISPGAIAQLKQHLIDFDGHGTVITSDYLAFNSPHAFAELLALKTQLGFDVRIHHSQAFHPKGYVFESGPSLTAVIGSSNLTSAALSSNHEWNLKVSAARGSHLAQQFEELVGREVSSSTPLTAEWIAEYASRYVPPPPRAAVRTPLGVGAERIQPNAMQQDALLALSLARAEGAERAIIISATGTGKTILSALDVRAAAPGRLLFIVHREQILDRTIASYQHVLGGSDSDYGKLTGRYKQADRRYVFATIQTLSQPQVLDGIDPDAFDYVIVDEAHRAGGPTYRRVLDTLKPRFLLGMTATPERTDAFNVFELFDYNVPYEIRLHDALEAEMLSPFHYYGVADVAFDDGTVLTAEAELNRLINPERIEHLIAKLDLYGQAGTQPCGLIFCSRKEEAQALSAALNARSLRGRALRTVALTSDDSIEHREQRVAELERGELDYLLTVDIFNEGVDIPSVNQVVMLRQTQSAIVFVQQLGRGLRLATGKDYLVVIDFIGNYANNYLIPIALFGDQTLNKESLREKLNEAVDGGSLPGLSSVSFDELSRDRVLRSITENRLDSMSNLKLAMTAMRDRVGRVPTLGDFHRFKSVDPVLLATREEHYPELARRLLRVETTLSPRASRYLALLSHEVLAAKRLHELVLLELLLDREVVTRSELTAGIATRGMLGSDTQVESAIDTLALRRYPQADQKRYVDGIAEVAGSRVRLTQEFLTEWADSPALVAATHDLVTTGFALIAERYAPDEPFTAGMQYSRRDAARILGWSRSTASTIYGYKVDEDLGVCAAFSTLHKAHDVDARTAYEDELLDPQTMRWFSKNNRTLESKDVRALTSGATTLHVFVQRDGAEGADHYYLGKAAVSEAIDTSMPDDSGKRLPVVRMHIRLERPLSEGLFDYLA
ncbi:DUF3427 domain-containing protein [Serinibacter arcticus]|uniref:DUF3427 domain-containing protein n=1 Tax=Serinibacter arcticus TaxID=1655435 RepID=A0A2U1ZX30_9MICO|nr:DEAD/DEAH box helicase [Serinibacter arcticus]PWD51493.1 DUF3427 domain-containing protein [Serinibacter arcticus]